MLRPTVSRPVCLGVKPASGAQDCQTVAGLLKQGARHDERAGLSFTIAAGPRQRSHSWVWVPRDSWPYFTVSDSRLPQPGGPGPCIYVPQEQGGPVMPSDTGFHFRRLPRLTGLRWRYSGPPPHGLLFKDRISSKYLRIQFVPHINTLHLRYGGQPVNAV
jgi:hypothetical protein